MLISIDMVTCPKAIHLYRNSISHRPPAHGRLWAYIVFIYIPIYRHMIYKMIIYICFQIDPVDFFIFNLILIFNIFFIFVLNHLETWVK